MSDATTDRAADKVAYLSNLLLRWSLWRHGGLDLSWRDTAHIAPSEARRWLA